MNAVAMITMMALGLQSGAAVAKKTVDTKACQAPVQKLIRQTAANMGVTEKFGLQLTEREPHDDVVEFASGAFIVEDGYLSNASAVVTVRIADGKCTPIKLDIVVGE